jgi:hypothetical protein
MLTGKLIKLLELLQQKHLPSARVAPGRNHKGFGLIVVEAASGGVLKRVTMQRPSEVHRGA